MFLKISLVLRVKTSETFERNKTQTKISNRLVDIPLQKGYCAIRQGIETRMDRIAKTQRRFANMAGFMITMLRGSNWWGGKPRLTAQLAYVRGSTSGDNRQIYQHHLHFFHQTSTTAATPIISNSTTSTTTDNTAITTTTLTNTEHTSFLGTWAYS